ncbi:MAG TPA: YdeI/OmpD-associated family protein [Prolixibacteraceae bacterium]|nr:YdeI/OmpD-associated family protein [Prolixibacteraceae bacterium]
MAIEYNYTTLLVKGPQNGVYAHFPYQSAKIFGTRKPVRVKAIFEGKNYEMNLLPRGNGSHWLHVKKEIRQAIGKREGDMVRICITPDNSEKKVELPEYLQWLLDNEPEMMAYFNRLSYSAKKFWVEFIDEPKSDDAKVTRINRLFEYLVENYSGKK